MSFGNDLSNEFKKLAGTIQYHEAELFTKLQDAFINLHNHKYRYAIDIVHGSRSLVDYAYAAYPLVSGYHNGDLITCELADMLFVVFSPTKKEIRLMFLQNKKGSSCTRVKADLLQLHLLKDRMPIISPKLPSCVFGDRYILQNAILRSVAAYGVFYENQGDVEMAYCPADTINPYSASGINKSRVTTYNHSNFGKTRTVAGFCESLGEIDLEHFADALIQMQIGTPVHDGMDIYPEVLSLLASKSASFRETWAVHEPGIREMGESKDWRGSPVACIINTDVAFNLSEKLDSPSNG